MKYCNGLQYDIQRAKYMSRGRYISYLRVSTERQGRSGLGLEAQRAAVAAFLNGGRSNLVAEVVEIESGKRADRPKLAEAMALCRLHNATLVIAKLDRLSRNVAFIANLIESGVEFVACDMPMANRLTIHILAAVAEHEREMISARTKAALEAARARGVRLGTPANLRNQDVGRAKGRARRAEIASNWIADLAPVVSEVRTAGANSLREIAAALNARSIPAARGGEWSAVQVMRVLERIPA